MYKVIARFTANDWTPTHWVVQDGTGGNINIPIGAYDAITEHEYNLSQLEKKKLHAMNYGSANESISDIAKRESEKYRGKK